MKAADYIKMGRQILQEVGKDAKPQIFVETIHRNGGTLPTSECLAKLLEAIEGPATRNLHAFFDEIRHSVLVLLSAALIQEDMATTVRAEGET